MSNEDELFGDSSGDDTDDLIAAAKSAPVATKKSTSGGSKGKRLQKKGGGKRKRDIPDADNDDSDDDNGSDIEAKDEEAALFDSDDDSDGGGASGKLKKIKQKKKKKKSRGADGGSSKKLSKKERMEALARKRQGVEGGGDGEPAAPKDPSDAGKKKRSEDRKEKGYDSGDSYDSATFERTKEDDDFIDNTGEDPDSLKELYAEQHFDDERPDDESDSEDEEGRKKKKNKGKANKARRSGPDSLDDLDLQGDEEPENPLMAAVYRMKKKKKEAKKQSDLEEISREFLAKMTEAADQDDQAIKERRPATKKLAMLPEVVDMLTKRDMMRMLLELDLLMVCKRWVQPLPSGALGNVTVRQRLLEAIANMTGKEGVTAEDLKSSAFGKVVMSLYMHKSETPQMKRQLKKLIEQWSRPIFKKSGNMKDLQRFQENRRDTGIVAIARAQQQEAAMAGGGVARGRESVNPARNQKDLTSIISKGYDSTGARDLGSNRVRVPYSKGFQFTVRPTARGDVPDKRNMRSGQVKEGRDALNKRMLEKNRPVSKNQRSANISIEGRPAK